MGQIALGGELVRDGQVDEGLRSIEEGIAVHRLLGADIGSTYWLALLAETHARRGAGDDALRVVDEALTLVETGQERLWEADLHRLKGDVLLGSLLPGAQRNDVGKRAQDEAAACFQRAIDVAREQDAKLWQLRAATRLARLWSAQRKKKRALELLAEVHDAFGEGATAPDLQAAASLLQQLRS